LDFFGCDALQRFLSPEPAKTIVEEEAGKFMISKVGGHLEKQMKKQQFSAGP